MNAAAILDTLLGLPLRSLHEASDEPGLYVLADHEGRHRYIGSTAGKTFRDRIRYRHTTGSEDRSHKFSSIYNVGRMWRDREAVGMEKKDGKVAKGLRTAFILRHCRAAWLPLALVRADLEALERSVIRSAPAGITAWNDRRGTISPMREPTALVDALIASLRFGPDQRAALDRQAVRFAALVR